MENFDIRPSEKTKGSYFFSKNLQNTQNTQNTQKSNLLHSHVLMQE